MGSNVKRAGLQCIATLMMAMVLLFDYQASAFSAITSSNSSGPEGNGSIQECFIVDDANLVFFADPEASLVASLKPGQVGKRTGNGGRQVIDNCGRYKPYHGCVPRPNPKPKIPEHCIYKDNNRNRNC
ncbi:hypothetical protein CRYUN_Cryun14cG0155600 [Craigia yunnanensis]